MALREINLVDPDLQVRRYMHRHLVLWAGGLILIQAVIFGIFLYQDRIVLPQKRALPQLNHVQANLRTRIQAITQAQKELEQLKDRHAMITTLTGSHPYTMILSRLIDSMGSAIWLTELELRSGSDQSHPQMKIVGFTAANEELGDFLDHLAAEPMFETVILKYAGTAQNSASHIKGANETPIQFEIEWGVSGG